ncbi:MAG: hypothetical protein KDI83_18155 [Gammaproteobacteria bacterium]|nr:hypothetical protein [Gammaproteobacteria bacterium]
MLLDQKSSTARRWGVEQLPVPFVIDPEGNLAYYALGARKWDDPALLVPLRALTLAR